MDKNGLEAIYRCVNKTKIKEVYIKTGKGTEIRFTRSDEEIKMGSRMTKEMSRPVKELISESASNRFDITSPQVGFFNRFDPKTKQQFQKLRDVVQKGEIVATIVSLHVHHNVIAEDTGKIIEFLVEQDQPVAYGQPLIRLEKIETEN